MEARIRAGEFDVVMRLMPIVSVLASPFGFFLRNGPIPFVVGPINGGLPWPAGFSQAQRQKEWISKFRGCYRFLPFARSTYRNAAAIIAGSSNTYAEFAAYKDKLFFIPENGVSRCLDTTRTGAVSRTTERLELIFVGSLVPYKACDLALRAAAPLLLKGACHFTIVGEGPERQNIEKLITSLRIDRAVTICGRLRYGETQERLAAADVLVFPSIREFGGAVVLEALASGTVPIVVDFGGPGDIVHEGVGFKVPLTNEDDVVLQISRILTDLADHPERVNLLQEQGIRYARQYLTWDAKARLVTDILCWVLQRGPKPDLRAPKTVNVS
jgi:glycosyltransferase involved in cell wall biosynthesis